MPGADKDLKRAVRYSYRLLSLRGRSEKQLRERLGRKGFSPDIVSLAIKNLSDNGYLNDSALASALKREAEEVKFLGLSGARAYLSEKGIRREIAEEMLEGYDELGCARKFADKKIRTLKNYSREIRDKKLRGALARRGFSYEVIRKTMEGC